MVEFWVPNTKNKEKTRNFPFLESLGAIGLFVYFVLSASVNLVFPESHVIRRYMALFDWLLSLSNIT